MNKLIVDAINIIYVQKIQRNILTIMAKNLIFFPFHPNVLNFTET